MHREYRRKSQDQSYMIYGRSAPAPTSTDLHKVTCGRCEHCKVINDHESAVKCVALRSPRKTYQRLNSLVQIDSRPQPPSASDTPEDDESTVLEPIAPGMLHAIDREHSSTYRSHNWGTFSEVEDQVGRPAFSARFTGDIAASAITASAIGLRKSSPIAMV